MSCINELLSKNCVPVEFEEFLLKLFQQTFQLLQRITKDTGAQAVDNLLTEQDEGYCVKHFSWVWCDGNKRDKEISIGHSQLHVGHARQVHKGQIIIITTIKNN